MVPLAEALLGKGYSLCIHDRNVSLARLVDALVIYLAARDATLVRFGIEGVLARVYGRGILRVLESDTVQTVVIGFIIIAVIGTVASAIVMWRNTRQPRMSPA